MFLKIAFFAMTVSSVVFNTQAMLVPAGAVRAEQAAVLSLDDLAREIDPNLAQKRIRRALKGDRPKCLDLFRQATVTGNAVAQLYLANAYMAMGWDKDSQKDFSHVDGMRLEDHAFAARGRDLLNHCLVEVATRKPGTYEDWKLLDAQRDLIIDEAARRGNSYAQLVQIVGPGNKHFGTACQIKPLLAKELFPELSYHFGASLFSSGLHNSQNELEGLKYMERSGFLRLKFFEDEKNRWTSFEEYCSFYVRCEDVVSTYYDRYGMRFVGVGTVLVPSKAHWENFKKEKLEPLVASPDELFDLFSRHDMELVKSVSGKYKLGFVSGILWGSPYLTIYIDHTTLGEIRIIDLKSRSTSDIALPEEYKALSPVISFLKDALACSYDGSAVSRIMNG